MDDRNFDSQTAQEWIEIIESDESKVRENDIYPLINSWIGKHSPEQILDLGCGQGICSDFIDLENRSYTGVDPSKFLIDRAKELHPDNRKFVVGNAYSLPFFDESFDAIFSVAVWHLLEDILKASLELSRVLKPGGSFLIITADPYQYPVWTERYNEKMTEGIRFEGKTQTSSDILFLRPEEEIFETLKTSRLQIEKHGRFRANLALSGIKHH